jgi:hypothetical protein
MSTDDMSLTPEESADGINLEDHEHILSIALLKVITVKENIRSAVDLFHSSALYQLDKATNNHNLVEQELKS